MELREALGGVSARCERYGEPYPMLFHIRKPTSLSEILELIDDEDARVGSLCRKTSRLVIKDYIKGMEIAEFDFPGSRGLTSYRADWTDWD